MISAKAGVREHTVVEENVRAIELPFKEREFLITPRENMIELVIDRGIV